MIHQQDKICGCCRSERESNNKPPRFRIPVYSQDAPLWLCEYCDGDALRMARDLEAGLAGE